MLRMCENGDGTVEDPDQGADPVPWTFDTDNNHPDPYLRPPRRDPQGKAEQADPERSSTAWHCMQNKLGGIVDDSIGSVASTPPGFSDTTFWMYNRIGLEPSWKLPLQKLKRDLKLTHQSLMEKLYAQDQVLDSTFDSIN